MCQQQNDKEIFATLIRHLLMQRVVAARLFLVQKIVKNKSLSPCPVIISLVTSQQFREREL
jgi:hypothetical protein